MEVLNSIVLNTRIGGGGPNIKIINLFSEKHLLKYPELDYLLLCDNKDLEIKAKCWKLPDKIKNSILDRYKSNNSGKFETYKRILENEIYLKYVSIKFKNEYLIIDMDDLQIKEDSDIFDLDDFNLEDKILDKKYNYINYNKKRNTKLGLYIGGNDIPAIKATERIIKIKTNDDEFIIRLCKDRKNLINRNSIEIKVNNLLKSINYTGVFIRENTYYRKEITNLKQSQIDL